MIYKIKNKTPFIDPQKAIDAIYKYEPEDYVCKKSLKIAKG
jgi:hypothetical protein